MGIFTRSAFDGIGLPRRTNITIVIRNPRESPDTDAINGPDGF